jgi:hypothetical protein
MKRRKAGFREAEIIMRLYELRRESVMREARSYVGGAFMPESVDEFVALASKGGKETGYILQVYGYWDMVAAFVLHGSLSEAIVYDTCQEMYFQYSKIQPYLKQFRAKMHLPEFLQSIEKVVEGSVKGRKRIADMRANMVRILETRSKAQAAGKADQG